MLSGKLNEEVEEIIAEIGCKMAKSDDFMLSAPSQSILFGSMVYDAYNRDKEICVVDECGELLFVTKDEEKHYKNISKVTEIIRGNV